MNCTGPKAPAHAAQRSWLHRKPLQSTTRKLQGPPPSKGRLQYTVRSNQNSRARKLLAEHAKDAPASAFPHAAVMATVNSLCAVYKLPPRFTSEDMENETTCPPLAVARDRYDSYNWYPDASPCIELKHTIYGSPAAGVFMNTPASREPRVMYAVPPFVALMPQKSMAYAYGCAERYTEDIVDLMRFAMDPVAFFFSLLDKEAKRTAQNFLPLPPMQLVRALARTPRMAAKIEAAELAATSLPSIYDFVLRLVERHAENRPAQLFPNFKLSRFDDPLPGTAHSREAKHGWFGHELLADLRAPAAQRHSHSQPRHPLHPPRTWTNVQKRVPTTAQAKLMRKPGLASFPPEKAKSVRKAMDLSSVAHAPSFPLRPDSTHPAPPPSCADHLLAPTRHTQMTKHRAV